MNYASRVSMLCKGIGMMKRKLKKQSMKMDGSIQGNPPLSCNYVFYVNENFKFIKSLGY